MTERWRPLSIRDSGDTTAYDGPFDGVPEWLVGPLAGWVRQRLPVRDGTLILWDTVAKYERLAIRLHISLEGTSQPVTNPVSMESNFYRIARTKPDILLDAADALLSDLQPGSESDSIKLFLDSTADTDAKAISTLAEILTLAGSAFRIQPKRGKTPAYLSRRVDAVTEASVDRELAREGAAAEHLREAWKYAFGRTPDPSSSYGRAIKAVESAAIPVICPANRRATLGTIIGDIRAAPNRWQLLLHHPDPPRQMSALAEWLDLLWKGQHDRHGEAEVVRNVTQAEAEAAVIQAVSLVALFSAGVVRPIENH